MPHTEPPPFPEEPGNPSKGLRLTQTILVSGSPPTCRRMNGYLAGGGNSNLFFAPRMSTLVTYPSQRVGLPASCGLQAAGSTAQLEKDGWWTTPPCTSVSLGQKDYLPPPEDFQGVQVYQVMCTCEETVVSWAIVPSDVCHLIWNALKDALQ